MIDLNSGDIRRILDLVEGSHFDYFDLRVGDLHLTVSKSPIGGVPAAAPQPPAPPLPAPATTPSERRSPHPGAEIPADGSGEGLVPVRAPMVGTFYARPEPGAPPYVEVGSRITEESTLGLIEVMKVYTQVYAGLRGVVDRILVQNAEFIEFGQVLFLVRPDEPTAERSA